MLDVIWGSLPNRGGTCCCDNLDSEMDESLANIGEGSVCLSGEGSCEDARGCAVLVERELPVGDALPNMEGEDGV